MNAWPFVTAAYAIALGVSAMMTLVSWRAMRRAEKDQR